ncbi:hypothetical protein DMA11_16890 [Marinilabiliaceae bacterium JC017]|nr:hypothetical protein DMA11_16890 [Marinilabiliaceae bacterium JC017]
MKEIHRTIAWIDNEIRDKNTGSPDELAGKLKMSVRLLFYYIDMMKLLGAPIEFSQEENTFRYQKQGYFFNGFKWMEDSFSTNENSLPHNRA